MGVFRAGLGFTAPTKIAAFASMSSPVSSIKFSSISSTRSSLYCNTIVTFFKVRILGHTSREIATNYGVPQGSPISPLRFLLYMSKLPKLLPNTRRPLFADDFMIYSESSITRSDLIQSNLQTSMDDLALFNSDHRIILSCTKSVRVLFERKKCNRLKPQDITYNGQVIPSSSSVKFRGITFNSALTFRSHFRTVATLARHRLLKLNYIFSSTYPFIV